MPSGDTTVLNADVTSGRSAQAIIEDAFGLRALEVGDVGGHFDIDFKHIKQETDRDVGDHFVFYMHLDADHDPTDAAVTDRQRCEIKTTNESLRGLENDTFSFSWRFKIDGLMQVSKKFTHLFQLKSVGGDESHPIVTLTGVKASPHDILEVRWSPSSCENDPERDTRFGQTDWSQLRDEWLEVTCRAKFSKDGFLDFELKRRANQEVLLCFIESNRSLWRDGQFVRPKWGIYRSLDDRQNLREIETVRFANFSITKE